MVTLATNSTPRLGLSKPDETELMSDPNLDRDWNDPMDILDSHSGCFNCTSGTRPANPYIGQLIRESDTSKLLIWDGANWIVYSTKDCGWHLTGLTDLTIPNLTNVILDGWSSTSMYNCSLVTNGIELATPGLYFACINVRWQQRAQNAMGFNRILYLEHVTAGGAPTPIIGHNNGSSANGANATVDFFYKNTAGLFVCTAPGQRIRPVVIQDSGGNYNLIATESWFAGTLLAPLESY